MLYKVNSQRSPFFGEILEFLRESELFPNVFVLIISKYKVFHNGKEIESFYLKSEAVKFALGICEKEGVKKEAQESEIPDIVEYYGTHENLIVIHRGDVTGEVKRRGFLAHELEPIKEQSK